MRPQHMSAPPPREVNHAAYFSQSALSLSRAAPTNSSTLAPFFHTWNVGIALMPQVAATSWF